MHERKLVDELEQASTKLDIASKPADAVIGREPSLASRKQSAA
jgi:hypothetical protein